MQLDNLNMVMDQVSKEVKIKVLEVHMVLQVSMVEDHPTLIQQEESILSLTKSPIFMIHFEQPLNA